MKANAQEVGAGIKESGYLQIPAIWMMWDSHLKVHHLLENGGLMLQSPCPPLLQGGRGNQTTEIKGAGCKVLYLWTSTVHFNKASDGPMSIILD